MTHQYIATSHLFPREGGYGEVKALSFIFATLSKFLISVGSYIAHFLDLGPQCIGFGISKTFQ